MLIEISLLMLLTITMFNVVLGAEFSNYLLPNAAYAQYVGIDEITGALAIIVAMIGIATIVGFQVIGSGISEESVRTIIIIIGYGSLWGFFSILSLNLIVAIELFGTLIYLSITIMYVIGVMRKIGA